MRFWHDLSDLPNDVRECLDSWNDLASEGFTFHLFDDHSASEYISDVYGDRELQAFARCDHPAMRCDYLRLCFIFAEGGLYVDADDVLLSDNWKRLFQNSNLKLQPLAYNITEGAMMSVTDIWQLDLPPANRVFYVNNDPIAAPPGHPLMGLALRSATEKLLCDVGPRHIQATTGPGNLTSALAKHAWRLRMSGLAVDFELLRDWSSIAEMRWDLGYRSDSRNWRNVYGC